MIGGAPRAGRCGHHALPISVGHNASLFNVILFHDTLIPDGCNEFIKHLICGCRVDDCSANQALAAGNILTLTSLYLPMYLHTYISIIHGTQGGGELLNF